MLRQMGPALDSIVDQVLKQNIKHKILQIWILRNTRNFENLGGYERDWTCLASFRLDDMLIKPNNFEASLIQLAFGHLCLTLQDGD